MPEDVDTNAAAVEAVEAAAEVPELTFRTIGEMPGDQGGDPSGKEVQGKGKGKGAEVVSSNADDEDSEGDDEGDDEKPKSKPEDEKKADPDASLGAFLRNALAENPLEAVLQLAEIVGVKDQVAKQLAPPSAAADVPEDYEPGSDLEKVLLPHREWLTKGKEQVETALRSQAETIDSMYIDGLAQRTQLQAIAEMLGVAFEAPDMREFWKYLNANKGKTAEDAMVAVYGEKVKRVIKQAKQKQQDRPDTLGAKSASKKPVGRIAGWRDALADAGIDLNQVRFT